MAGSETPYGIGYDVSFELNEFGQPKLRSEIELIKNTILFILFAKPGQYPSLPHIGIDIQSLLYSFFDELDTEQLKINIAEQCEALGACFDIGLIDFKKVLYRGKPSLLIHIEGEENYPDGYMKDSIDEANKYLIGISFNDLNKMVYSISTQGGN